MKKPLFFIFCFLFLALSLSAAGWLRQDIAKIASFRFPAQPHISVTGNLTNYLYLTDSCSYLVQTKAYNDEGKVHDNITLLAFYDGMVKGMIKGAKGTFVRKDSIGVAGLKGVEVEYVKGDQHSLWRSRSTSLLWTILPR